MIKTRDVIASIESSLKSYKKCSDVCYCQWIDEYIINNTSILNYTKQYVLNHGPGLCKNGVMTCS